MTGRTDSKGVEIVDNEIRFDYYYGNEADQFSFYRIPRILIKDERFKGISNDMQVEEAFDCGEISA